MRHILILFATLLFCNLALSEDITLAWDPSVSEDVTGYYLFIGNASRLYSQNVDVGNMTTYQLLDLTEGRWFFTVQAYGADNRISDFSNEVFVIINHDGSLYRLTPPLLQGGI